MKNQLPSTVTMWSWPALFITVWLNRDVDGTRSDLDADRAHARRHSPPKLRQRVLRSRVTRADRAWRTAQATNVALSTQTGDTVADANDVLPTAVDPRGSHAPSSRTGAAGGGHPGAETPWFEVDLFPPARVRAGSRFDDTVALPIDAPRRLAAIEQAAELRLRALPPVTELGHRPLRYRRRLQQLSLDAAQARARLDEGTYGACLSCAEDIALAVLIDRPWVRQCTRCELDI